MATKSPSSLAGNSPTTWLSHGGGSLIGKDCQGLCELAHLGWVEPKPVKFFGAQATGCSPISDGVKRNLPRYQPQKPNTIARSAGHRHPADGPFALRLIRESGGWAEDISDPEIIDSIKLLAETEGIFAETAGGVTTGVTPSSSRRAAYVPTRPPSSASPETAEDHRRHRRGLPAHRSHRAAPRSL